MTKLSIEQYLQNVASHVEDEHGMRIRQHFADASGKRELEMLQAPSADELNELRRAVAMMTPSEKKNAQSLTDEQVQRIADDANVDPANLAIFFNGFALQCKRVP